MSNWYAQAIEVLFDSKTDFRAIAFEVAKQNPKAIAAAAARLERGFGWQRECLPLMQAGQLIPAIKRCRELTGMTLVDAKNACQALVA